MNMNNELSEERCKLLLEKGWIVNDDGTITSSSGNISGKDNNGYIRLVTRIDKKVINVMAHHLVFYNTFGYVPHQINHINHNRKDNRIENLEPSNPFHNTQNRKIKGRCYNWYERDQHWQIKRKFMYKIYNICYTKDEEEAKRLGSELRSLKTLEEILEFKNKYTNY